MNNPVDVDCLFSCAIFITLNIDIGPADYDMNFLFLCRKT